MNPIIQLSHLSKRYKGFSALEDVSLEIEKGEIYGFIGLNGSGKTTTIKTLLGMIRPSNGACYIQGKKVELANHSLWAKVGSLVETPYAYPELTVRENLPAFFACYGKGYLAPIGFILFMVVLAQIIAAAGYGEFSPWAVPAIFSGMTGPGPSLGIGSFLLVYLTGIVGLAATVSWWMYADQH